MLRTTEPDSFFVFFAISFPVKLQRRRPTQKAKQRRDSLTLCLSGRRPIRRGRRGETLIWLVGAGFCGRTVDLPSVSCLRKCKVIETHWWLHAWHDATWTASLFVCHSSSVVSSDAENIIRRLHPCLEQLTRNSRSLNVLNVAAGAKILAFYTTAKSLVFYTKAKFLVFYNATMAGKFTETYPAVVMEQVEDHHLPPRSAILVVESLTHYGHYFTTKRNSPFKIL